MKHLPISLMFVFLTILAQASQAEPCKDLKSCYELRNEIQDEVKAKIAVLQEESQPHIDKIDQVIEEITSKETVFIAYLTEKDSDDIDTKVSYQRAESFCKRQGGRLPNARELAKWASRGDFPRMRIYDSKFPMSNTSSKEIGQEYRDLLDNTGLNIFPLRAFDKDGNEVVEFYYWNRYDPFDFINRNPFVEYYEPPTIWGSQESPEKKGHVVVLDGLTGGLSHESKYISKHNGVDNLNHEARCVALD